MKSTDNLVQSTRIFLSPDYILKFSRALNEPPGKVKQGLRSIIPTFLKGLVLKGTSPDGAKSLVSIAKEDGVTVKGSNIDITDPRYLKKGADAIEKIFGKRLQAIIHALGTRTGMDARVIIRVMSIIAPPVMGTIKRKINTEELSTQEVIVFLNHQKEILERLRDSAKAEAREEKRVLLPTLLTSFIIFVFLLALLFSSWSDELMKF